MDRQNCSLNFIPWPFEFKMKVKWIDSLYLDGRNGSFTSLHHRFNEETFEIVEIERKDRHNRMLVITYQFERHLTLSLITIYFPSALIVLISFVSFWLDSQSVPGRVSLVITSLLTLITQLLHIRSQLPAISRVTALDIWFFVCVSFISSALFEFALSYNFARKVSTCIESL